MKEFQVSSFSDILLELRVSRVFNLDFYKVNKTAHVLLIEFSNSSLLFSLPL